MSEIKLKQPISAGNEQFLKLEEIVHNAIEEQKISSGKLLEYENRQRAVDGCLINLKAEVKVPTGRLP